VHELEGNLGEGGASLSREHSRKRDRNIGRVGRKTML